MSTTKRGILAAAAAVAVVLVLVHVVSTYDYTGRQGDRLSPQFTHDTKGLRKIDPGLLTWREQSTLETAMDAPRGIAVGPDKLLYVAGDNLVRAIDQTGLAIREIETTGPARCVAVADDLTVYVGVEGGVESYDQHGRKITQWKAPSEQAVVTGLAVTDDAVYVADSGGRIVLRYSRDGQLRNRIARRDPVDGYPGLKVPSPSLTVAVDSQGRIVVTNPGHMRIETHTPAGEFQFDWGESSNVDIRGFSPCCNPCGIAIDGKGNILTAEKGTNFETVKVFDRDGHLMSVVAGPDRFDPGTRYLQVAWSHDGQAVVLDPARKQVRLFSQIEKDSE